jgi:hypothetical protein
MNEALRDHVTSAAFVLSLGKTHVAELVRMDLELAAEVRLDGRELGKLSRYDTTARRGLQHRGLVVHVFDMNKWHPGGKPSREWIDLVARGDFPPGENWNITRAGRLVCELLTEAGIYQEYAGPILPLIEARREKKRAS